MKKKMNLILLLACCSMTSCSDGGENGKDNGAKGEKAYFEYSNPQYFADIDKGNNFRDPCIVKEGDTYYLTGTRYPHFEEWGEVPGTAIYKSTDLKNGNGYAIPFLVPRREAKRGGNTISGRRNSSSGTGSTTTP